MGAQDAVSIIVSFPSGWDYFSCWWFASDHLSSMCSGYYGLNGMVSMAWPYNYVAHTMIL